MRKGRVVCVDFDGTICEHRFPEIGPPVPHAFESIKALQAEGIKVVLFTVRSGRFLDEAIEFCKEHGLEFYGINRNPDQDDWTESPKPYGNAYVDDNAIGCPLVRPQGGRPYVDWPMVLLRLTEHLAR